MRKKQVVLSAVAGIAILAVLIAGKITYAQRPGGTGGDQRGMRGGGMMNPTSLIDNSWVDLTFSVKVDDKTLIGARPIYQKSRDDLANAMKEAREAGDFEGMREKMTKVREEFKASLKKVLSEEQIAQLDKLEQERAQQMMRRGDGGRPGGGDRQ
jgi:hypothetical protein